MLDSQNSADTGRLELCKFEANLGCIAKFQGIQGYIVRSCSLCPLPPKKEDEEEETS